MRSRASARLPCPCICIHTIPFFLLSFFSPRNPCMYECRYCSIKAELPCRRLHTPAGAGPQKVVPVTRCTLVTAGKARVGGVADNDAGLLSSCAHSDKVGGDVGGEATNTARAAHNARCRHVGFLPPCLPPQRNSRLIMPRTQIRQVSPRRAGKDTPCGESAETLPTHQVALCVG